MKTPRLISTPCNSPPAYRVDGSEPPRVGVCLSQTCLEEGGPGRARLAASISENCLFKSIQLLCFHLCIWLRQACSLLPSTVWHSGSLLHFAPTLGAQPLHHVPSVFPKVPGVSIPHSHSRMIALRVRRSWIWEVGIAGSGPYAETKQNLTKQQQQQKKTMPVGIGEDAWGSEKCMQEDAGRLGFYSWFLLLSGCGTLGKLGFLFSWNEAPGLDSL